MTLPMTGIAQALSRRLGAFQPEVFLVLGSGVGGLADGIEPHARVPYRDLPGMPSPGVEGHIGEFLAGTLAGRRVLCQRGRLHMYEGFAPDVAVLPVRLAAEAGCTTMIITNAAGSLDPEVKPPALMLITDHLNLTGRSGLEGPVMPPETRFPDMTRAYDPRLAELAHKAAQTLGVPMYAGVYVGLLGPAYETPAEVRMLRTLGGAAVGMSTVLEVVVARARGMRVLGFSILTNLAAGLGESVLGHDDVLAAGKQVGKNLERVVAEVLRGL